MPLASLVLAVAFQVASPAATASAPPASPSASGIDWREAEKGILENHVQLTFPDRFVKAGESYFSPDDKRIIFQAVEKPKAGQEAEPFYAMYIADVVRDSGGAIASLANIRRLSPPGSANTCGWFDPLDPLTAIFASTLGAPSEGQAPGYQRGTGRYRWMFPPEMRIVMADLKKADGSPQWEQSITPLIGDGKAYVAEGSTSPDGKWLIYCDLAQNQGDIWVLNRENGDKIPLVTAPGYDGGPFFAPDGKRICFRSDRAGNNMLQVFVADLAFDATGHITGIKEEHQVTRDANVNWCPYFHPSGKFLVFAGSGVGHQNYEIFAVDAGMVDRDGVPQSRYGTNLRRVTFADGADVLPVFSHDGQWMLWTGQRGDDRSSQLYVATWKLPVDPVIPPPPMGSPSRGEATKGDSAKPAAGRSN